MENLQTREAHYGAKQLKPMNDVTLWRENPESRDGRSILWREILEAMEN